MTDATTSPGLRLRTFFCRESYLPTVLKSIKRWGACNLETHPMKAIIYGSEAWQLVSFEATDMAAVRCIRDWKRDISREPMQIFQVQLVRIPEERWNPDIPACPDCGVKLQFTWCQFPTTEDGYEGVRPLRMYVCTECGSVFSHRYLKMGE